MTVIKNETQYEKTMQRIEELLHVVGNDTPVDNKDFVELDLLSELAADYEAAHYPITMPSLVEAIRLRMYEMELTQKDLSELLEVSTSRISEYLTGKSEPTLHVARNIHKKLGIDARIVLG